MPRWWETKKAAWAGLIIELGVGGVMTYLLPQYGIPLCILLVVLGIFLLVRAYKYKDESKEKRQLHLDLGKFLLDGKEILADLEKMNAQVDSMSAVSAELKFEIWYKDVSKTLSKTGFNQLWYKNKVGLDYRKARKSDYIEACKYGLDRLEYIKQLMLDKGD